MDYKESIIIRNATDLPMTECLNYIEAVIAMGRVSDDGRSYCFVTSFKDGIHVAAHKRKDSDVFNIWKDKEGKQDG